MKGGSTAQWSANLLPDQLVRVLFSAFLNTEEIIVNVAEVCLINQRYGWEESGQWVKYVDRTHVLLVSCWLVLQKTFLKIALARGNLGSFGFRLFSHCCGALDHSAFAPPSLNLNSSSGARKPQPISLIYALLDDFRIATHLK